MVKGFPLREWAQVSGATMNEVYGTLREMSPPDLLEMWLAADPSTPFGALLRHQISLTVERRLSGRW